MSKIDSASLCACAAFGAMALADSVGGHPVYSVLFSAVCGAYFGRIAVLLVVKGAP